MICFKACEMQMEILWLFPFLTRVFRTQWSKIKLATVYTQTQIWHIWTSSWQNQQNDLYAKRRPRSAWAMIRPVWSEFSQCTQWISEDPMLLRVDREDSEQTGRMPRLIWAFVRRKRSFCWFCHAAAHMCQICVLVSTVASLIFDYWILNNHVRNVNIYIYEMNFNFSEVRRSMNTVGPEQN